MQAESGAAATADGLLAPPRKLRRLQIEVTTHCNLACVECSRTVGVRAGTWTDTHLGLAQLKTLIANSPPAEILVLQGVGEPLLNPELVAITAYARTSGRFRLITLNSNAVTRDIDYFRRLRQAGLNYVCVSVDSFHPDIAEACRGGTRVAKLKSQFVAIYREFNAVVVSMVASRLNLFDLPQTLRELDELGAEVFVDRRFVVEIQPVIDYQPAGANVPSNALDRGQLAMLKRMIETIQPALPRLALQLNTATIDQPHRGTRCARPFFSPFITARGYLTPCCTTFDPAIYGHTNILMMTMAEAWTTPAVRDWLARYLNRGDAICEGCCYNIGGLSKG